MTTILEPLTSFLPHVTVYVPDAPQPAALMMLRLAAAEFCEATALWRDVIEIDVPEEPTSLRPEIEAATIVRIERASYEDTALIPIAFVDLEASDVDTSMRGVPRYLSQITENEVIMAPWPDSPSGSLFLSVILKPVVGSRFGVVPGSTLQADQNRVPRFLFENHADIIAHGACAKLMMMPRQSFTDPQNAGVHLAAFENAKMQRATNGFSGQHSAKPRIRAQFF